MKQLPLTKLKGCGKLFYQPRYVVRWQWGKVRKQLETMQLADSEVCGAYRKGIARRFSRTGCGVRSHVLLCETCLRKVGISW